MCLLFSIIFNIHHFHYNFLSKVRVSRVNDAGEGKKSAPQKVFLNENGRYFTMEMVRTSLKFNFTILVSNLLLNTFIVSTEFFLIVKDRIYC